jgi:hypothetical protein
VLPEDSCNPLAAEDKYDTEITYDKSERKRPIIWRQGNYVASFNPFPKQLKNTTFKLWDLSDFFLFRFTFIFIDTETEAQR